MGNRHGGWGALAIAGLLAGCASTGQDAGSMLGGIHESFQGMVGSVKNAVSGAFDWRTRELRQMVEQGDFRQAARAYAANEHAYGPNAAPLVAEIARRLNEEHAPEAINAAEDLEAIAATDDPEDWPRTKAALARALRIVRDYEGEDFLRHPERRAKQIDALEARRSTLEQALVDAAPRAFARYPHGRLPEFFEHYPVQLAPDVQGRLVREHFKAWLAGVRDGDEAVSRTLVRAYGPAATDPAQREALAEAFAVAMARHRGWSAPYSLVQLLELSAALADAVPGARALAARLALLVVVADAAPELPWDGARTGLAAFTATPIELPRRLRQLLGQEKFAHVIVADPSRIALIDRTLDFALQRSERRAGRREEPNPEWEERRREVAESEQELIKAEADNQQLQRQAVELSRAYQGRGAGAFGAVLGSGTGTWLVESARTSVRRAREAFAGTPRTRWKDVMQPYRYATARRERTVLHEVALYLVEAGAKTAKRALITERRTRSATVVEGVDANDPQRAAMEAASARELRELEALGPQTVLVPPEELLDRLRRHDQFTEVPADALAPTLIAERRQFRSGQALERARAREDSRAAEQQLERYAGVAAPRAQVERLQLASQARVPPARAAAAADAEARAALCPRDMRHLASRIRTAEVRSHLSQPVTDMIGKAGSVDRAIAMSHAQMREFERTRNQARRAALQSYGGPGAALRAPCPRPESIYCASANTYFTMVDSMLYTNEVVKALSCYKAAGIR